MVPLPSGRSLMLVSAVMQPEVIAASSRTLDEADESTHGVDSVRDALGRAASRYPKRGRVSRESGGCARSGALADGFVGIADQAPKGLEGETRGLADLPERLGGRLPHLARRRRPARR